MMSGFPFLKKGTKRLFFCGICGVSMLSLAIFAKKRGYEVHGSDSGVSEQTVRACRKNGIPLYFSHERENIIGCDAFIYTAAIAENNPELIYAKELGLQILNRSRFLGGIIDLFSSSVAVSGTHGKSTSTSMLYSVFTACGLNPTLFAGANGTKNDALMIGSDDMVIFEACEYNRSFLDMHPSSAVILNIEKEHTDIYPTLKDSTDAFFDFSNACKEVILNAGSEPCRDVAKRLEQVGVKTHFFSLDKTKNSLFAENLCCRRGFYTFDAVYKGTPLIKNITMSVPGLHNVSNALSAILVAHIKGIGAPEQIKQGVESFTGLKRRFEYIGNINGADVYDDYAHHPTEIKATVKTALSLGYKKIICVFQPHTYSRTYEFWDDFKTAFEGCDEVILTDIFPAREKNIYGVYSKDLAYQIKNGKYIKGFDEIVDYLRVSSHPQTLILTMGAGKLCDVADILCGKN